MSYKIHHNYYHASPIVKVGKSHQLNIYASQKKPVKKKRKCVDEVRIDLYDILNVSSKCTKTQLRKSFQNLMHKKEIYNGDSNRFNLIIEAYEILKNDKTRKIYNSNFCGSAADAYVGCYGTCPMAFIMYWIGLEYHIDDDDVDNMKKYYHMAIDKGSSDAMYTLGKWYEEQKDFDNMKKYYEMTINNKNSPYDDSIFKDNARYFLDKYLETGT